MLLGNLVLIIIGMMMSGMMQKFSIKDRFRIPNGLEMAKTSLRNLIPKQIEIVTHEIPIEIIKEVEVPRKEDNYGLMKLLLRNLFWAASSLIWNTVTTHPVAVIEAIAALTVVSVFILKVLKG